MCLKCGLIWVCIHLAKCVTHKRRLLRTECVSWASLRISLHCCVLSPMCGNVSAPPDRICACAHPPPERRPDKGLSRTVRRHCWTQCPMTSEGCSRRLLNERRNYFFWLTKGMFVCELWRCVNVSMRVWVLLTFFYPCYLPTVLLPDYWHVIATLAVECLLMYNTYYCLYSKK